MATKISQLLSYMYVVSIWLSSEMSLYVCLDMSTWPYLFWQSLGFFVTWYKIMILQIKNECKTNSYAAVFHDFILVLLGLVTFILTTRWRYQQNLSFFFSFHHFKPVWNTQLLQTEHILKSKIKSPKYIGRIQNMLVRNRQQLRQIKVVARLV